MDVSELQKIKQRYNIVGNSDGLNHALDVALQVAPTDLSVLIIGESGVGKEIIPRVIHDNSPRRREKYFAINCGSIPEGTIDSELLVMRRVPSQVPSARVRVISVSPTRVPSSWMKWVSCLFRLRLDCFVCWRQANISG